MLVCYEVTLLISTPCLQELCIERNKNVAIKDTVKRMSDDASGKLTKMLFPTLTEAVNIGDLNGFKYLTFIVALFCRLFTNVD